MTGVEISAQNLIEQLRLAFPEIEARYQEEVRSWDGEFPGNYNVFAFIFKPFLKKKLAEENNRDFLVRLCGFMEKICTSHDKEAINVLWLKVFKFLLTDASMVRRLWPFMGAATKANMADAALRWGMIRNVPATGLIESFRHWVGQE